MSLFFRNEKEIEWIRVGKILLVRSTRARNLRISVRPFKPVRVTVPFRVSFRQAEGFLEEKREWLISQVSRMKEIEQKLSTGGISDEDINRESARIQLTARVNFLAGLHGFTYSQLIFRSQNTRWGSCSVKNSISLNIRLVKLPDHLIDYVILHELMHTRVKNHSNQFWSEFSRILPNAKKLDKELNGFRLLNKRFLHNPE